MVHQSALSLCFHQHRSGSQPVAWRGQSFPYLLHHQGFLQTENYSSVKTEHGSDKHHTATDVGVDPAGDRTGTWSGPAPRGYVETPMHAADEAAPTIVHEPETIAVRGGARMPLLGLGTYKLDSAEAVKTALNVGYRHIDCARIYGNERVIGEGLKEFLSREGARKELWITSKIWNDAHRPPALRASVEQTLADLGCDYLDLLLIHWPHSWLPGTQDEDPQASLEETWGAMEDLVDAGMVRHLGVSNFGLAQVEAILETARHKPVVNQVELHPLLAQRKLVGVCSRKGVQCVAYSPLGHSSRVLLDHPVVQEVAASVGKTPAQVLLRWSVQRGVPAVPKAGSEPHLRENVEGLFAWRLGWKEKAALDGLDEGRRFVTSDWHVWPDAEEGGVAKPSTIL